MNLPNNLITYKNGDEVLLELKTPRKLNVFWYLTTLFQCVIIKLMKKGKLIRAYKRNRKHIINWFLFGLVLGIFLIILGIAGRSDFEACMKGMC